MAVVLISTNSKTRADKLGRAFRPIYYLGCKTSFTSEILAAINEVDTTGGRVLDLFAGTGSVGLALGVSREVTSVDIQEYSRVLCSAVLNPSGLSQNEIKEFVACATSNETSKQVFWCLEPLIDHEIKCINAAVSGDCSSLVELLESPPLAVRATPEFAATFTSLSNAANEVIRRFYEVGLWHSPATTVARYFGGVYFSFTQAAMLDAVLSAAESSSEQDRDTLKAAALSTASQLVNTVGKQFAQPIQPRNKSGKVKISLVKVVERDRLMDVLELYKVWLRKYASLPRAIGNPKAHQQDYLDAITKHGKSCSVIYADPPYTRDHYSRFYHVLETMCLRDSPLISKVMKDGSLMPSRGAYREERHQSNFCIRSAAPAAFDALFKSAREHNLPLVLSYSPHEADDGTHPRVVSISQILRIADQYYKRVEVCTVNGIKHNQLNRSGLKLKTREHAEIILKCFCS